MSSQTEVISTKPRYTIAYYERPGLHWSRRKIELFVDQLRHVAALSLGLSSPKLLPQYQCLIYDGLDDKLITVAYDPSNSDRVIAFLSGVLLDIPSLSHPVLHLGLVCILPEFSSGGITQALCNRLARGFITKRPDVMLGLRNAWFTNCSSVGRILCGAAMALDMVYPSPQHPPSNGPPTTAHALISDAIANSPSFRASMYVLPTATFDHTANVFRGSVEGTVFTKKKEDESHHHRDIELNGFYADLLDWERGDEVLQVGCISLLSVLKHWRKMKAKL